MNDTIVDRLYRPNAVKYQQSLAALLKQAGDYPKQIVEKAAAAKSSEPGLGAIIDIKA